MTEDTNNDGIGEDVYYYAGNITNNFVSFAGALWQIIRSNEDGSIRLIYSDYKIEINKLLNKDYNSDVIPAYAPVTYMFGEINTLDSLRSNAWDSSIKVIIDDWYANNLLTDYDKYVSKTAIYCADRTVVESSYGASPMYFGAMYRQNLYAPTYKCGGNGSGGLFESTQAVADKFSVSTSKGGNGQLTYPIAEITSDEAMYSGLSGSYTSEGKNSWLLSDATGGTCATYWTMTPAGVDEDPVNSVSGNLTFVISLNQQYNLFPQHKGISACVRPVLSLKSCVEWESGDGTYNNPYILSISDSCASNEN